MGRHGYLRKVGAAAFALSMIGLSGCFPDPEPTGGPSASANCPATEDCPPEVTVSGSGVTATASFGDGADDATLTVSINPLNAPAFDCVEYPRQPAAVVIEFHFSGGDASDRFGTLSTTFESPDSEPDLSAFQVCWAAPYQFLQEPSLDFAPVQGVKPGTGDPLYVGVLPACEQGEDYFLPAPCVSDKWYDSETNLIHIDVYTTGEDPWRY